MKHPPSIAQLLSVEAGRLDLSLSPDRIRSLAEAMEWLGPAAFRFGLTNYATTPEFTANLVAPALVLLADGVFGRVNSPALDFGAGSGAVGLALAVLCPEIEVILADRRTRVVQFLDLSLRRLQLTNCTARQADLANPPADLALAIGTVLIRAFGPTPTALTYASRLIRPGGSIALWHQPPAPPPPADLRLLDTHSTGVPSLALTLYQRGL